MPIRELSLEEFVAVARSRWKVENEPFNTFKKQGYHLEHNYGHGKKYLATNFAMLTILAFLVDQTTQYFKRVWDKKLIRTHETEDACLIFDDSIIEKRYTAESSLICWHYDHSTGQKVKGINLLTAFYYSHNPDQELALRARVSFKLILKTQHF